MGQAEVRDSGLKVMERSRDKVWIAGSGPSLELFDWGTAGPNRIGINHAAVHVPDCWLATAIDYDAVDYLKKRIRPPTSIVSRIRSKTGCDFEPEIEGKCLYQEFDPMLYCSTLEYTLLLCHQMGFEEMYMVGFDSRNLEYRRSGWIDVPQVNGYAYDYINNEADKLIEKYELKVTWL